MVTLKEVEQQLDAIGANSHYWGRPEIEELQHILVPGEQIKACIYGHYQGGFATFVATDQRLLLVDKKLFYLTVEDMRYDMINEVDYSAQLFSGTIRVCTPTKNLSFTSFKPRALRKTTNYIQQHVMEVRHRYEAQGQEQTVQPVAAADAQPQPQPQPVVTLQPVPSEPLNGMYTSMLGNQALNAADKPSLPLPQRRNPYMNPPLMTRRRIGRFGPIGTPGL